MKIAKNEKLLLIGDSVTDAGRSRPVAEGLFNPHGTGYPNIVQGLLTAVYPDLFVRVVNMGVSGNTTRDLRARWKTDVIDLKPDWVSVMIGINDIWRQFDVPHMPETHVLPDEYAANLDALVAQTIPLVKGMLVISPVYWEPNKTDAMAALTMRYGEICKNIAARRGAIFVDAQAAADAALRHCHSAYIAWDRVHPNIPGHNIIAREVLNAIGFDFNRKA